MSDKVLMLNYQLTFRGKKLSQDRLQCIKSLEFGENDDGADTLSMTILDPEYKFINDNIFVEDVKVTAKIFWYGDPYVHEFKGYISAIDLSFPEEGFPALVIHCIDNTHVMNRKPKSRSWENVTNADVVEKIAKEYGFKVVIQKGYSFKKHDSLSQSDQTDIEFLESLAESELYLFTCKLIDDTIHYVKKGLLGESKHTLGYRTAPFNATSFTPRINKETRKEELESSSLKGKDKSLDSSKSNKNNTNSDTQGDPVDSSSSQTTQKGYTYDYAGNWVNNSDKIGG